MTRSLFRIPPLPPLRRPPLRRILLPGALLVAVLAAVLAYFALVFPLLSAQTDLTLLEEARLAEAAPASICSQRTGMEPFTASAVASLTGARARLLRQLGETRSLLRLGQAYCHQGEYRSAVGAFTAYVQAHPTDPTGTLWQGAALASACAPALPQAPQMPPEYACPDETLRAAALASWQAAGQGLPFLIQSSDQAITANQPAAALYWANWAILAAPDNSPAWKARAAALAALAPAAAPPENAPAVWEAAAFAYGQSYRLNQADIPAARAQAQTLLESLSRPADAAAILAPIAANDPADIASRLLLGRAYEQMGEPDAAEQAYTGAARAAREAALALDDPLRAEPFAALGEFYLRQARLDDARAAFSEGISRDPYALRAAASWWGLGRVSLEEHQPAPARRAFEAGLANSPASAYLRSQLHYGLAQAALLEGSTPAAVQELTAAVEQDPNNPGLRLLLAQTLAGAGRKPEALEVYRAYLEQWPGDAAAAAAYAALKEELNVP